MKRTAPKTYPPGHFTALIRAKDWPPAFVPRFGKVDDSARRSAAAVEVRERQAVAGTGWGQGTVLMPGTPAYSRPGMLSKAGT